MYIYICTYIYIYTDIHVHILVYTYTHTLKQFRGTVTSGDELTWTFGPRLGCPTEFQIHQET